MDDINPTFENNDKPLCIINVQNSYFMSISLDADSDSDYVAHKKERYEAIKKLKEEDHKEYDAVRNRLCLERWGKSFDQLAEEGAFSTRYSGPNGGGYPWG